MKVSDIVSFSKESFFNGAVQTEWFYDDSKVGAIAESYVFHGTKYYGVSSNDIKSGAHQLLDTASFAKNLTDKLYAARPNNSFVMTIAGYGTGKSHLAVCLGALFSGDAGATDSVIQNIAATDAEIGNYIREKNTRKNFVIVLNGMNNFNLDAEILRCARLSLSRYGLKDDIFRKLTKSYDIAKHFVEHMFSLCQEKFNQAAEKHGLKLKDTALKNYLLSHVETENKALLVINTVYEEVNGDKIAWDRGLSAGDILLTVQEELCGEGKPFNKVLLLFDEFGRYIEYTAANPTIAGEAALQQIFEAIQTANGKIIFTGFIQSELKAYLSRIEKTANITRYIDRYRTACENLFLSSNFETILANILKKANPAFDRVVGAAVGRYENYHNKIRSKLSRWDRSTIKKSVWTAEDLYNSVILKGCFPLHPITVWLLSSAHQWMQQRSTLAFASEMFEQVAKSEIEGTWLPYIYPVQIIDSGIFNEMLNSEEKGLVASQYCMLYRDIIVKVGDKLSDLEKTILKAVLVVNMGRMSFYDKDDAVTAIRYCSNTSEDEVKHALKSLEEMHGVVAYDDHSKTYDLIAEANGFNEFRRIFAKYRLGVKVTIDDIDEELLVQLGMTTPVETSFGQDKHISSTEWSFTRWIVEASEVTEGYLCSAVKATTDNCNGENPRGVLIYAYCHTNASSEAKRISALYKNLDISSNPVIILFLDDSEGEVLSALTVKKALQKFSLADKERFKKHIADQQRSQNNKIIRKFTSCVAKRSMVGTAGLESYNTRINGLCTQCFTRLFTKAVPFAFDGFENKNKTQAKGTLVTLCVGLLNHTLTNMQVYGSLTPKDKNRVSAVLSTKSAHSWKVFDDKCQLVEPQQPLMREIMEEVTRALESGERCSVYSLFNKYTLAPYGMNENSLSLFVCYFIGYHGNTYLYTINNEKLTAKHWSDTKGKLKIPEIRKIFIQKNANVHADPVKDLCQKILAVNTVEPCAQLKRDVAALVAQEGENDQNKYLVAQANTHLDDGGRLSKLIYDKLSKARAIIDESQKKFVMIKVVKAFEMIPVITPFIEDGYSFVYSDDFKQSVLKLQIDLKALLDRYSLRAIGVLRCDITELSQFKITYSRIAKILRDNACEEYAVAIEKRVSEVEAELLAKQHYESSLIECEKDLAISSTISKYQEAEDLVNKLTGWLSFIDGAKDLPVPVSKPLRDCIVAAISSVWKVKDGVMDDYRSAILAVANAGNVAELKQVDSKLARLMQAQLPEECLKNIVLRQEAILAALRYIEELPSEIDALTSVVSKISQQTNEYCHKAIKHCAVDAKEKLEREEGKWIVKFVEVAEANYHTMTPQECTSWLEKTKVVPAYFSSKAVARYHKVRELVEGQLHHARVDGVLSMYDLLSETEKLEFRRRLEKR